MLLSYSEDDIELIQGDDGLVVCVPDDTKPLSVISSRAPNQWKYVQCLLKYINNNIIVNTMCHKVLYFYFKL